MATLRINLTEADCRDLRQAIIATGTVEAGGSSMVGKAGHGEAFAKLYNKISNAQDKAR